MPLVDSRFDDRYWTGHTDRNGEAGLITGSSAQDRAEGGGGVNLKSQRCRRKQITGAALT